MELSTFALGLHLRPSSFARSQNFQAVSEKFLTRARARAHTRACARAQVGRKRRSADLSFEFRSRTIDPSYRLGGIFATREAERGRRRRRRSCVLVYPSYAGKKNKNLPGEPPRMYVSRGGGRGGGLLGRTFSPPSEPPTGRPLDRYRTRSIAISFSPVSVALSRSRFLSLT